MNSNELSPSSSAADANAIKYATLIPNRVFVGGISANTTEQELKVYFSKHGAVKDTKIISDRTGVSKGYGFVTFETQEDAEKIIKKEGENFIFKERKLNIGHAYRRQQPYPKGYGDAGANGQMLVGMPYMFQSPTLTYLPDGSYALAAQQPATPTAAMPYSLTTMGQPLYQYYPQSVAGSAAALGATTNAMYQFYQPTSPELMYASPQAAAAVQAASPTFTSPQAAATASAETGTIGTALPQSAATTAAGVGPGGDPHMITDAATHEAGVTHGSAVAQQQQLTAYVQQQAVVAASTASPQHPSYAQLGGGGVMSTSLPAAHVAYRPY